MDDISHPPDRLWTATDLADYLGKPVKYVYRLTNERRIQHYVIGRELRFDPADVAAFVARTMCAVPAPPAAIDRAGVRPRRRPRTYELGA